MVYFSFEFWFVFLCTYQLCIGNFSFHYTLRWIVVWGSKICKIFTSQKWYAIFGRDFRLFLALHQKSMGNLWVNCAEINCSFFDWKRKKKLLFRKVHFCLDHIFKFTSQKKNIKKFLLPWKVHHLQLWKNSSRLFLCRVCTTNKNTFVSIDVYDMTESRNQNFVSFSTFVQSVRHRMNSKWNVYVGFNCVLRHAERWSCA